MDAHGDAVSLGDEDIIKSTQFFSEDSQVPSAAEPRFLYESSQTAAYSQPQYVPQASMHPPQVNHSQENRITPLSQISYGHQSAWPNYGPGYASVLHPMQQLLGSGLYPHIVAGNLRGMSPAYMSACHTGPADGYLYSQVADGGCGPSNMEWLRTQNVSSAVQDLHHRAAILDQSQRTLDPHPLSARQPLSTGGPWICPRPRETGHEERQQGTAEDRHIGSAQAVLPGDKSFRAHNKANPQASELRQSPHAESTEAQRGRRRSTSVECCHRQSASGSQDSRRQSHVKSSSTSMGGIQNASKSETPECLMKCKVVRVDGKSYRKEVKMAISEGRVPQVIVEQDENGNLVRYRPQFLNALKLAADAIVQDAYINVKEEDTMNEIMQEVRRQFILPKPLPTGMVENYLKGYFKRCRSQYHKFWIRHGDTKKPEGCKKAAWLQLIEYWNSPEGSKECEQNKENASTMKRNLEKKMKSDVEGLPGAEDPAEVEATGSPVDNSGDSDSLDFKHSMPKTMTTPSSSKARDPMADISNQLHDAVDTILSSFAAQCRSLPSSSMTTGATKALTEALGSASAKNDRAVIRSASEVIGSLKRPVEADKDTGDRSSVPIRRGRMTAFGKKSCNEGIKSVDPGVHEKEGVRENEVHIVKEELVMLSSEASDDSSDVPDITELRKGHSGDAEKVAHKSSGVDTEEIGGWQRMPTESGSAINQKAKVRIIGNEASLKTKKLKEDRLAHSKKKLFIDKEKSHDSFLREECMKGKTSKVPTSKSAQDDVGDSSDAESMSEEENEEEYMRDAELDNESEEDEPPVLPREIQKRKFGKNNVDMSEKELKGKVSRKSTKTPPKKQKVTQVDVSLMKKLEYYKRPKNSHPIKTRTRVWVLHPQFPGKVVAEASAGVNRKSRCVDSANEICKEGQQMIHVLRIIRKNTPVMYDKESRFPKQISYLDQAEGLPNTPVLWCISHLMEIPPLDQITKLIGDFVQPLSQEAGKSDSDFEGSMKKRERNFTVGSNKEKKGVQLQKAGAAKAQTSKGSRTVLRSAVP